MTEEERDYVSQIVETSLRVVNRHQFFVWTQGALQRLVPHEILLCGIDDGTRLGFEQFHFTSCRYFREVHFEAVCDREHGLLSHFTRAPRQDRTLVVMCPSLSPEAEDPELNILVQENELRNLAACLWLDRRNKLQAFYSFSRVAAPFDERLAFFLEIMIPYLHVTFMRVLAYEEDGAARNGNHAGRIVTKRQEEILRLIREGKTNVQIADILAVSPWTVKNHIQMIFHRLNTSNRTQTITRAISLGILRPE